MAPKKKIVIVGAGGGGGQLARALSGQLDGVRYQITLIDSRPFFPFYVAALRTLVTDEGSLENQILIPLDKLFINGNGTFIQGSVTAIEAERGSKSGGRVILDNVQSVNYDVLVLSPGSKWESLLDFPLEKKKAHEHIQEWRGKFQNAKKVVICGGGAVGIELAAELRYYYPNKTVTIVHGDKKLLNKAYPDKFRDNVENRIRSRGVDLILDDFVDSLTASTTRKGVRLEADLVVPARGPRPNTKWIASSLGEDVVNDKGFVRITPTMQLVAYPSIFALGDIIDYPEQKQLGKYPAHSSVVAANVTSLLNDKQPIKEYKGQAEMIVVTMGKSHGASILFGMTFGDWVTSLVKGKGLFITTYRKNYGLLA